VTAICPSCRARLPEAPGDIGCQALVEQLWTREFGDFRYARLHRLSVDAYCVQHPDRYCASAKSLAAHLCGLCCHFEHGGHPAVYRALQRWLDGARELAKPELPESRGELTLLEPCAAQDPDSYASAVERWARSVWDAHAPVQPVARKWLEQSLAGQGSGR
jgi:uncharacterized protein DUF5946